VNAADKTNRLKIDVSIAAILCHHRGAVEEFSRGLSISSPHLREGKGCNTPSVSSSITR
jgi:hypothetical protein